MKENTLIMVIWSLLAIKVLAIIAVNVTAIWAIVEFILYLVKDKLFNWMSVWLLIVSVALVLITMVISYIVNSIYLNQ